MVFALDSIPAIFGLTSDAYVIFTANAFALMGLRQLFFLVGDLLNRLTYLNTGLAVVLGFIGVKLTVEALADSHVRSIGPIDLPEISIAFSLIFIGATLGVTAAVSLLASFWRERRGHQKQRRRATTRGGTDRCRRRPRRRQRRPTPRTSGDRPVRDPVTRVVGGVVRGTGNWLHRSWTSAARIV